MYSFTNDYSEGAHPRILNSLMESNLVQAGGYGEDQYTMKAIDLLKQKIGRRDIYIHLLSGGTQTNLTAISAFLRPHEAAIAANTGHIAVHETGAIEATGHKVLTVNSPDGKLTPSLIEPVLNAHDDEHMVKPKLVYISNSTELGTVYTKKELEDMNRFCRERNLLLYMDGARLGSALCWEGCGLTLYDVAGFVDAFYIGGTKNGAMLGEALVICNPNLNEDFRYHIKQKGGLLAKGRLLGIQFLELFKDDLFFELASRANKLAQRLAQGIRESGYSFLSDSPTNQIFPILPNKLIHELLKKYSFSIWSKIDEDTSAVRLVTSWATREDAVEEFLIDIKNDPA